MHKNLRKKLFFDKEKKKLIRFFGTGFFSNSNHDDFYG